MNPHEFVIAFRAHFNLKRNQLADILDKKGGYHTIRKWEEQQNNVPVSDLAAMAMIVHGTKLVPPDLLTPEFLKKYMDEIIEWCQGRFIDKKGRTRRPLV